MRFHPLEKLINLHDNYTRQFKIDNLQLLLVQRAGECFLFEATCPHRGHPLMDATIEGGVIQCPMHNYRFDVISGALKYCTEEPCRALQVFALVYEGNEVGLMLDDSLG
jgi:nitrite reductase/ring-hydroxylating ferredoxin subunit